MQKNLHISKICCTFAAKFDGGQNIHKKNNPKKLKKIMTINKQNAHEFSFGLTKKGNLKAMRNGKPLDKCAMSFYFPAWSYYSIYWDTANKNEMVKSLWTIWSNIIDNIEEEKKEK